MIQSARQTAFYSPLHHRIRVQQEQNTCQRHKVNVGPKPKASACLELGPRGSVETFNPEPHSQTFALLYSVQTANIIYAVGTLYAWL